MGKIGKFVIKAVLGIVLFIFIYDIIGSGLSIALEALPHRLPKNTKTTMVGDMKLPINPLKNKPFPYLGIHSETFISLHQRLALINHAVYPGLGIAIIDNKDRFIEWLPGGELELLEEGELKSAGEVFDWWHVRSLNGSYQNVIALQFGIVGTAMVHPFYLYAKQGENWNLVLELINPASRTEIRDIDEDGKTEIVHNFSLSGSGKLERDLLRWKDIWRIEENKAILVNHQFPQEYEDLIALYDKSLVIYPDAKRYYPVLKCLKSKAQLVSKGQKAEIEECQKLLLLNNVQ